MILEAATLALALNSATMPEGRAQVSNPPILQAAAQKCCLGKQGPFPDKAKPRGDGKPKAKRPPPYGGNEGARPRPRY